MKRKKVKISLVTDYVFQYLETFIIKNNFLDLISIYSKVTGLSVTQISHYFLYTSHKDGRENSTQQKQQSPESERAQCQRSHLPMQKTQETWFQSLGQEDPLKEEMETHSSILARKIKWTEEPGRLKSLGSQRVRHD